MLVAVYDQHSDFTVGHNALYTRIQLPDNIRIERIERIRPINGQNRGFVVSDDFDIGHISFLYL